METVLEVHDRVLQFVYTWVLLPVLIAVFAAIVAGLCVGVFMVLAELMDSIIDRKATKSDQSPTD